MMPSNSGGDVAQMLLTMLFSPSPSATFKSFCASGGWSDSWPMQLCSSAIRTVNCFAVSPVSCNFTSSPKQCEDCKEKHAGVGKDHRGGPLLVLCIIPSVTWIVQLHSALHQLPPILLMAQELQMEKDTLQIGKMKPFKGINAIPSFSLESLHNSGL